MSISGIQNGWMDIYARKCISTDFNPTRDSYDDYVKKKANWDTHWRWCCCGTRQMCIQKDYRTYTTRRFYFLCTYHNLASVWPFFKNIIMTPKTVNWIFRWPSRALRESTLQDFFFYQVRIKQTQKCKHTHTHTHDKLSSFYFKHRWSWVNWSGENKCTFAQGGYSFTHKPHTSAQMSSAWKWIASWAPLDNGTKMSGRRILNSVKCEGCQYLSWILTFDNIYFVRHESANDCIREKKANESQECITW